MEQCKFCKRVPTRVFKPKGILLKAIQKTKPNTTETTPMCSTCYNKAVAQLNRYKEKVKRNLTTHLATLSAVESVRSTSDSSSIDSFDRLTRQRSMLSIRRMRQATAQQEQTKLPSPRSLSFPASIFSQSQTRSDTSSDPGLPAVAIDAPAAETRNTSESPDVSIIPVETRNTSESTDVPIIPVESAPSETVPRNVIVREYESDEEVEVQREGDHLPGVQPYIKKRRTRVIFTDERLIPVYNNKSYGG